MDQACHWLLFPDYYYNLYFPEIRPEIEKNICRHSEKLCIIIGSSSSQGFQQQRIEWRSSNLQELQQWRCGRGCSERAWVRQKLCTLNVVKLLLQDKNNKMFSTKIIKVCCSLFIIYWKQAAPAAADRCYILRIWKYFILVIPFHCTYSIYCDCRMCWWNERLFCSVASWQCRAGV